VHLPRPFGQRLAVVLVATQGANGGELRGVLSIDVVLRGGEPRGMAAMLAGHARHRVRLRVASAGRRHGGAFVRDAETRRAPDASSVDPLQDLGPGAGVELTEEEILLPYLPWYDGDGGRPTFIETAEVTRGSEGQMDVIHDMDTD